MVSDSQYPIFFDESYEISFAVMEEQTYRGRMTIITKEGRKGLQRRDVLRSSWKGLKGSGEGL